jgi:hypothetical protein
MSLGGRVRGARALSTQPAPVGDAPSAALTPADIYLGIEGALTYGSTGNINTSFAAPLYSLLVLHLYRQDNSTPVVPTLTQAGASYQLLASAICGTSGSPNVSGRVCVFAVVGGVFSPSGNLTSTGIAAGTSWDLTWIGADTGANKGIWASNVTGVLSASSVATSGSLSVTTATSPGRVAKFMAAILAPTGSLTATPFGTSFWGQGFVLSGTSGRRCATFIAMGRYSLDFPDPTNPATTVTVTSDAGNIGYVTLNVNSFQP